MCSIEPSLVDASSDYTCARAEAKAAKAKAKAEAKAEARAEAEAAAEAQAGKEREAAEQIAAAEAAEAALEAGASKRARVAEPTSSAASQRHPKSAGKTASRLASASKGDFHMSESARMALEEIKGCANNLKEFQYNEKKRTTAGGLFLVSACGLFLGAPLQCHAQRATDNR